MQNYYETPGVKEFIIKGYNPNFGKKHYIEIPARILIIGPSASGKTNTLINLLKCFNGTYNHIYLNLKNKNEPLYNMLIKKLGNDITVTEDAKVIPLSEIQEDGEQLVIFDDLVKDKKANLIIEEYFKLGRKKHITAIYLSQSFYATPKFIRDNISILIIKKISSKREMKMILTDYPIGELTVDQLQQIYNKFTKNFLDCLVINVLHHHIYHNFMKLII